MAACAAPIAGAEQGKITTLSTATWRGLASGSDTQAMAERVVTLPMTLPFQPALQRLVFTVPLAKPDKLAVLLIPRASNAVWVEWNEHVVAQAGMPQAGLAQANPRNSSYDNYNNYNAYSGDSHQPLRVELPAALWRDGAAQQLVVTLAATHLQPLELAPFQVGSAAAIEPLYQQSMLLHLELPWAVAGAVLALGLTTLLIGVLARDRPYLLLAAASLSTAAHMIMLWVENPLTVLGAGGLWPLLYRLMLPCFVVSAGFFWITVLGMPQRWLRLMLCLAVPFQAGVLWLLFSGDQHSELYRTVSIAANLAVAMTCMALIGAAAFSKPAVARAMLFVFLCCLLLGLIYGISTYGLLSLRVFLFPWLPYAMTVFCVLMTWELIEGFNRSLRSTRINASYFEAQLAAKRAELNASFVALRDASSKQAVEGERRRIMSEIHDGLGSSLVNAMSLVNRRDPAQEPIGMALQDSMSELRMAIDALQPHEADLLTALGTMRTRVQPALKSAGIDLLWEVEPVPEISRLTPENTLHLYRFVQEAFANVIKHSHASAVTLRTGYNSKRDTVSVMIDDNGIGWRPDEPGVHKGGGTETLRLRAQKLGGWAHIEPLAPGTSVQLTFPRHAPLAQDFSPSMQPVF